MNQFMTFREQLFQGDAKQSIYHTSCQDEFKVKISKPKKIVESLKYLFFQPIRKQNNSKSKGPGPGQYNIMIQAKECNQI
ncbi:hypothetical protein pb186bvf_019357 [Paramecium bursaria]